MSRMGIGREFFKGSTQAFVFNCLGKVLAFLAHLLLARWLSAGGYGAYSYVMALAQILMLAGQFGLNTTLVRFVAAYRVEKQWAKLRGILVISNRIAAVISILILAAGEVAVWMLSERLDPLLKYSMQIGLVLVPLMVLSGLRQQALRGLKLIVASSFPESVITPAIVILGVLILKQSQVSGATYAILLEIIAAAAAFLVGAWWLLRSVPGEVKRAQPEYNLREVLSVSLPLLLIVSSHQVMNRTDVLILGHFAGMADVGVYSAISRLSSFVAFGLTAVNAIAAPMISETFAKGRLKELKRIVALTSLGGTLFASLVSVVFLLFGEQVLGLFGQDFSKGIYPLWVVVLGQFVNSVAGPVGLLLTMTGHEKDFSKIMILTTVINLMLNLLLVPPYGIMGAAVASTSSLILWNVWTGFLVSQRIGVNPTFIGMPLTALWARQSPVR